MPQEFKNPFKKTSPLHSEFLKPQSNDGSVKPIAETVQEKEEISEISFEEFEKNRVEGFAKYNEFITHAKKINKGNIEEEKTRTVDGGIFSQNGDIYEFPYYINMVKKILLSKENDIKFIAYQDLYLDTVDDKAYILEKVALMNQVEKEPKKENKKSFYSFGELYKVDMVLLSEDQKKEEFKKRNISEKEIFEISKNK